MNSQNAHSAFSNKLFLASLPPNGEPQNLTEVDGQRCIDNGGRTSVIRPIPNGTTHATYSRSFGISFRLFHLRVNLYCCAVSETAIHYSLHRKKYRFACLRGSQWDHSRPRALATIMPCDTWLHNYTFCTSSFAQKKPLIRNFIVSRNGIRGITKNFGCRLKRANHYVNILVHSYLVTLSQLRR